MTSRTVFNNSDYTIPVTIDSSPEEVVAKCLDWISLIRADIESNLDNARIEAIKYYNSEPMGNERPGRSKVVTSDLLETVEWILPSMLRIFASEEEVLKLDPRSQEDTEAVKLQHELANWQMKVRNNWFVVLHDVIKDALLLKTGIIKYQWVRETTKRQKQYSGLSAQEFMTAAEELRKQPNVEILSAEPETIAGDPLETTYSIRVSVKVEDEYPLIEAVPPDEFGFPIRAKDIDTCPFLYHRVAMYPWEVEKKYGVEVLEKIKELINEEGEDSRVEVNVARFSDVGGEDFFFNKQDKKYWVYECYFPDEKTGTALVAVICGDVLMEYRENEYMRPPFHVASPIRLSHRLIGKSIHDLTRECQRLRTVLLRQILDNIYFSNNGRYIMDPQRVNVDDFLNENKPGGVVRGDPSGIKEILPPPLQPWAFKLMEFVQGERESKVGITRLNQGLEADSLNKTARGIQALLGQSQQRIELMARVFAELLVGPLVHSIIDLNIMFMTKKTSLRVANKWYEISPDNLVGQYDILINVGIGTGSKDMIIAQMQQLLGLYAQIFKVGVPIVTAENVYNAMTELVKAMGYRNTRDFVSDPKLVETVQGLVQYVMQIIQQTGLQDPQLMQLLQQVVSVVGVGNIGPGQGGAASLPSPGEGAATQPNLPQEPAQPLNPIITPTGNGYYGL